MISKKTSLAIALLCFLGLWLVLRFGLHGVLAVLLHLAGVFFVAAAVSRQQGGFMNIKRMVGWFLLLTFALNLIGKGNTNPVYLSVILGSGFILAIDGCTNWIVKQDT